MFTKALAGILLLLLLICYRISAQDIEKKFRNSNDLDWYLSINLGTQMSGIKNEDFIRSNYSPLFNIVAGKWFAPSIALQLGYRGWYFNTISDHIMHRFDYYFGEVVLNMNSLINVCNEQNKWNSFIQIGSGYFYNFNYRRPNICDIIEISNNYKLSSKLSANLSISAIMGWDIYQGDEDILPGISLGFRYTFNKHLSKN